MASKLWPYIMILTVNLGNDNKNIITEKNWYVVTFMLKPNI